MRARMAWLTHLLLALLVGSVAPSVLAHKASDAYLVVAQSAPATVELQLSLALKDLDAALDMLDADNDRQLRWAEVKAAMPAIVRWVGEGIAWQCAGNAVAPAWRLQSPERRSDGVYLRLGATLACDPAGGLALDYALMKDIDPTHRLLLSGALQGQPVVAVVAPQAGRSVYALGGGTGARPGTATGSTADAARTPAPMGASGLATLANFFREGVHHIVTGYDHLAFLLALLLPIMLRSRTRQPGAPPALPHRPGLPALALTVTGFTVGHSTTLVLASLGFIHAAPGWVEPAIAITIAISAGLNLYPVRWVRGDVLALLFGLIHGLGFSGVMAEAGVTGSLLVWALAGFNLGVEAGQMACVLAWCAVHLLLVRWSRYEQVVVRGGSWALVALALYWATERLVS
jgi:HupE / UreJ protein